MIIKSVIKEVFKNKIARRYFIMNTFDGVLTVLGILIALYLGRIVDERIIIASCIGSGVAMGVSGFWGAYLTEAAEWKLKVMTLEKHLLRRLKGTRTARKSREAVIMVSLVNGSSSLFTMVILIIPFLMAQLISIEWAYNSSFIMSFILMALLGVLIARISKEKIIVSALKMLTAGVVIIAILYLLELMKVV